MRTLRQNRFKSTGKTIQLDMKPHAPGELTERIPRHQVLSLISPKFPEVFRFPSPRIRPRSTKRSVPPTINNSSLLGKERTLTDTGSTKHTSYFKTHFFKDFMLADAQEKFEQNEREEEECFEELCHLLRVK